MKISLKNAQKYSTVDLTPNGVEALVEAIGKQLGAVETVENWGSYYEGIVVARVVSCQPHPEADKLSICLLDDGNTVDDVDRNQDGLVQVVCGANNVAADQMIAWIPPGATVPETATGDPFVLSAKELRGVVSNGMIASRRELMMSDDHDGILVLDDHELGEDIKLQTGMPLSQLFNLDDTVIDLENKMFTHRPDCFGTLGVARELAAIQGQSFKSPDWYLNKPELVKADSSNLSGSIDTTNAGRLLLIDIEGVTVGPSPAWLQSALMRVGIKPINNIVDITNFVMHLTAQPMHAYDYDKLKQPNFSVRQAAKDERLSLINGQTIKLDSDDVVIDAGGEVVGLAGVMGGSGSEVSEQTKRIVLESATFNMYSVRRSAMRHGLFSEAVTRFNKGQSPAQNDRAAAYALSLVEKLAGGKSVDSVDEQTTDFAQAKVSAGLDFINERLGSELSSAEIAGLLENAEIPTSVEGSQIIVEPPFWRMDLELAEDIVEEVGRLYGFHNLPVELPKRPTRPAARSNKLDFEAKIRDSLAGFGANEVLTYNFVHSSLVKMATQDESNGYKLRNALSPQLQYYRQSLTPGLAERIYPNLRAGNDEVVLFEIGASHHKKAVDSVEAELPREITGLSLVVSVADKLERQKQTGAAYFWARNYLENLMQSLNINFEIEPMDDESLAEQSSFQPFELTRSAIVLVDGQPVGVVGELKPSLSSGLKLPSYSAAFELDLDTTLELADEIRPTYSQVSRFPTTERDVTIKLDDQVNFGQLKDLIDGFKFDDQLKVSIEPLGMFRAESSDKFRNISFRLSFGSSLKTLTAEEVNKQIDDLATSLKSSFDAQII